MSITQPSLCPHLLTSFGCLASGTSQNNLEGPRTGRPAWGSLARDPGEEGNLGGSCCSHSDEGLRLWQRGLEWGPVIGQEVGGNEFRPQGSSWKESRTVV